MQLAHARASKGGVYRRLLYIPTMDLAGDRGETAKQLVAALEDPGFLYIKNVQGYDPGMAGSILPCVL